MRRILLGFFGVVALLLVGTSLSPSRSPSIDTLSEPGNLAGRDLLPALSPFDWKQSATETLLKAGWTLTEVDRVFALNRDWFSILSEEDPTELDDQLHALSRLGHRPAVLRFVQKFPQTAGLLAMVPEPEKVVDVFERNADDLGLLLGLYARHVDRRDIVALTGALDRDGKLICRLIRRGLIGAEVLFTSGGSGPGAGEYAMWLRENLSDRLSTSDDENLSSFVHFVAVSGEGLHDRLDRDESFRRRFRGELWPSLVRAMDKRNESIEFYMDEPGVWSLVTRDRGEELLTRRGFLAIALLEGREAYPKDLHERVIGILLSGDGATFRALVAGPFRKQAKFRRLLRRPLSDLVLATALNNLLEKGDKYGTLLDEYDRLTDAALAEEVGPAPEGYQTWLPGYSYYVLARKASQDRTPTTGEVADATVDAVIDLASFLFPPAQGGKVLTQSTKKVGTAILKKQAALEMSRLGVKAASKRIKQEAAELLVKEGLETHTRRLAVSQIFTEMQVNYRRMLRTLENASAVEITRPVQYFFRHAPLGRASWKRLAGLEARVFMRDDAKVFIHVERLAGRGAKCYLNRMLEEGLKKGVAEAIDDLAWDRHLAAWWLLHAAH